MDKAQQGKKETYACGMGKRGRVIKKHPYDR